MNLEHSVKPLHDPHELASQMAGLASQLRDSIIGAFKNNGASDRLRDLYRLFQKMLPLETDEAEFADMFAQTVACGLFAARCNHPGETLFSRQDAARELPSTNLLLRRLFDTLASPLFDDEPFASFVDELARVLACTDMGAVLADFGKVTRQEDPIGHFYELFLTHYDPRLRELRGVYYTPEPVVSYIVRSVDHLLRTRFACAAGLADTETISYTVQGGDGQSQTESIPRVLILDPATGAGTFLSHVIEHIRASYQATGDVEMWHRYVHEQLFARLCGFELLAAPYAMAHLKLGMQLAAFNLPPAERAAWRCDSTTDEQRPGIYLANTLDEAARRSQAIFGHAFAGATRKREDGQACPVMVVLGNPPYAGHSANKEQWITGLVETYKAGYPGLDKPAQTKWLSDDYVKFLRFSQWCVEQTGSGIVAFITNHSYLDNPTFRGMRYSLMQSFNDIYILDLHGNSKKREKAPDGSKDENVFTIQTGVAIGIFVRQPERGKSGLAKIHHADLWGPREVLAGSYHPAGGKYLWLSEHSLSNTSWSEVTPQAPFYLFAPHNSAFSGEYEQGWKIPDIFRPNGDPAPGIVTTQDEFAISWTREEAIAKVERLLATNTEAEARELFRLCSQNQWQYAPARKELSRNQWRDELVEALYRPFDVRWTVFSRYVAVHRRERVTRHMLAGKNLGMAIGHASQVIEQDEWNIVFCARQVTDFNLFRRGGNHLFPLYLYPGATTANLFEGGLSGVESQDRQVNLAEDFLADFAGKLRLTFKLDGADNLQRTFGPEDVFHYMYAIFHSPTYRKRYAEFLKIDFPRLPLTSNADLFRALCALGERLVGLHLMEKRGAITTRYPEKGNNVVEKIDYTCPAHEPEMGRVWINETQYFDSVPPKAWEFHIGGYQVCSKWLKDRKGRRLKFNDIQHYQRIVAALGETITLMEQIDEAIEKHGGWPIS